MSVTAIISAIMLFLKTAGKGIDIWWSMTIEKDKKVKKKKKEAFIEFKAGQKEKNLSKKIAAWDRVNRLKGKRGKSRR